MVIIPSGRHEILYLVARKYPHVRDVYSPRIRYLPEPQADRQTLKILADKYGEQLARLTPEEIDALVTIEREAEAIEFTEIEARQWFNKPECMAEWDYWSAAEFWTLEEATVLSLGKDPRRVTINSVERDKKYLTFPREFANRMELAKRAKVMDKLSDFNRPIDFVRWANSVGLPYAAEMNVILERYNTGRADWKARFETEAVEHEKTRQELQRVLAEYEAARPKELQSRERESLLKLVLGMAIAGYRYNPVANKNSAVKEIADDLRRFGIPLDEDTVRRYIQLAKAEFADLKTEQDD